MHTAAETKATLFLERINERIARSREPHRYTAEVKVEHYDYPQNSTAAVVTIRDGRVDGSLWVQWYSQDERPNTARFLGGSYRYSLLGKDRTIRKNYRKLWDAVHAIVY